LPPSAAKKALAKTFNLALHVSMASEACQAQAPRAPGASAGHQLGKQVRKKSLSKLVSARI
jgi:hypothetical protein